MEISRPQLATLGVAAALSLLLGVGMVIGVPSERPAEPVARGEEAPAPAALRGVRAEQIPAAPRPVDDWREVDGVRVADLVVGDGAEAVPGARVAIEYVGWLANGRPFDASYVRPDPFPMGVGNGDVIPGLDAGVVGMRVGGRRQIVVPPEQGWGGARHGPVPAHSTVTFEVELVEVGAVRLAPERVPVPATWETHGGLPTHDLQAGEGAGVQAGQLVTADVTVFEPDGSKPLRSTWRDAQPTRFVVGAPEQQPPGAAAIVGLAAGGSRLVRLDDRLVQFDLHAIGPLRRPPAQPAASSPEVRPSGLGVAELVVGEGESPRKGDRVWVEYTAWVPSGEVIDSTLHRPQPLDFELATSPVLRALHEGVEGMRVGGRRQLRVPPELGFGDEARGRIDPDATLTVEVELVAVGQPPA